MAIISDKDKKLLGEKFHELKDEVKLVVFTQETECAFCREARDMVLEIGGISPKIRVEVYDFMKDATLAKKYGIDKIPAIGILGKKDYGVRYYGVPAGYEFSSLVDDIIDVSKGATNLSENIKKRLAEVNRPVHIQVFVTPTCPYCPIAVRTAHQLAIENDNIRADMVEISEFPYLAQKYAVMSVPKVVINEDFSFIGSQPPEHFIEHIQIALRTRDNPMYS